MRVGLRVARSSSGGGWVFIDKLSAALAASRNCSSVTVFTLGNSARNQLEGVDAVEVEVPGGALYRRIRGKGALGRALREHPVDVLVAPGTEVTHVEGTPTIMWPLTVAPFEPPAIQQLGRTLRDRLRWWLLRQAIQSTAKDADAFIFSSHYARGLYRYAVPVVAQRPTAVLHPAPSLALDASPTSPPSSRPFALFVSHLYPYKMVQELIEGFVLARREYGIPHSLMLAGSPVDRNYFDSLKSLVVHLDVEDCVLFLGALPPSELLKLYAAADVFLFPSLSENAGSYALLDAFLHGLPVLSSSTSSMPEICGDAARYFDPRDPEQMAWEFSKLVLDREDRAEMARRSTTRGAGLPRWEDTADGLLTFLERIL